MPRFLLEIEYKGTDYSGWQIQPDALTIEGELEAAFSRILQQPIDLIGQGRTDAGVHAKGQTAHVDLPEDSDIYKLIHGVNSLVGYAIHIKHIEPVSDDFHARFDALTRLYRYTVLDYPSPLLIDQAWYSGNTIKLSELRACAELIEGEHDFNGFSKYNEENFTTLCYIYRAKWVNEPNYIYFEIEANRFLRNMVRRLVGTMMEVSRGKISRADFAKILNNEMEAPAAYTAPAKGLVLQEVFYKK